MTDAPTIPSTLPCPKCRGTCHGPKYQKRTWGFIQHDYLAYRCSSCGYVREEPTADAK